MANYEFFLVSSLEKVFPDRRPAPMEKETRLSAWRGTRAAVQLVYKAEDEDGFVPLQEFELSVIGAPCNTEFRKVELIPSDFPCYGRRDDQYIKTEPGLFPDLLKPFEAKTIRPITGQYRSIWLSWDIPKDAFPGEYKVQICVKAVEQKVLPNNVVFEDEAMKDFAFEESFTLHIGKDLLPKQSMIHTEWFHVDSLADYYQTEVFSEPHWKLIENYIQAAGEHHGINMLLTPVFTPPLDTKVGGERRTVQLVDVRYEEGEYSFGFEKLKRWARICKKYGIEYLEIAHLFTQWGATSAPKIVATVNGKEKRIFGWETKAAGKEYKNFLENFLPQLRRELEKLGYDESHVYFHISDEPSKEQMENYKAARGVVKELIPEDQIIDAMSSLEFFNTGLLKHPIPGTSEVDEFYQAGVPDLWVYYCCGQCVDVPNRFFAMESARNRIMGVLMYLHDIQGFLHWGYNFYYTQYAIEPVNPYEMTHAGYAFPSGDAFLVYPGKDGRPLDSIRSEVQVEALTDLRALQHLESLTSREFVEEIIYENLKERPMTFRQYPKEASWILNLRERVATEIEKRS